MDGLLNVYKERGFTSFDVVAKLRGILGERKIGHLGTLDPEAEGVLPVLLGRATRLSQALSEGEKVYRTVLLLGVSTDTQDTTGKLLARREVTSAPEDVKKTILSFLGEQEQLPPMVSAKKVGGVKLVDAARAGIIINRKTERINVREIEILDISLPRVSLRIRCSKGTYIRTLCHDMGEKLGCGGCMESLVREEAAGLRLEDALRLDEISSLSMTEHLEESITPLEGLLSAYPCFQTLEKNDRLAENGNVLKLHQGIVTELLQEEKLFGVMTSRKVYVGLFTPDIKRGLLKPYCMLGSALKAEKAKPVGSVISIGKFDGVHVGHSAIIHKMRELAEREKLRTVLISFTNTPESITGGKAIKNLSTADEKRAELKSLGVQTIVESRFTDGLRQIPAKDFLERILIGRFGMRHIVAGPDCSFGKNREGNVAFLKEQAALLGFGLTIVDKVKVENEIVSSSRIKELLKRGELREAAECLGRPYEIEGRVAYGRHLGESLGFPTLNINVPEEKISLPYGVYAAKAEIEGRYYRAMLNWGVKPTISREEKEGIEAYILDASENWYGKKVKISFYELMRGEKRFDSLKELKAQLEKDKEAVISFFDNHPELK